MRGSMRFSTKQSLYSQKKAICINLRIYNRETHIELEYGSKDYYAGEDPIYSSYSNPEWVIQHEMDHLEGITIQDKGAALI